MNELSVLSNTGDVAAVATPQSIYDRVDPMSLLEWLGKALSQTGACGCKTPAQGNLVAFACHSMRKNPFDLDREYHLIDGRLIPKAERLLIWFIRAGGKHEWIADGTDGKTATLKLIKADGTSRIHSFGIERAERMGLIKDGSAWKKNPGPMLRARCSSEAIKLFAPEIADGYLTEEEIEEENPPRVVEAVATTRTPDAIAARREELRRMAAQSESVAVVESAGVVAAPEPVWEAPPFEVSSPRPAPQTAAPDAVLIDPVDADRMEFSLLAPQVGFSVNEVLSGLNMRHGTAYGTIDDVPADRLADLVQKMREKVQKKSRQPAASA